MPSTSIAAGLYLVATPIGNLRDMTLRAIDVLNEADLVLCEDTRVTGKLLQAHSIKAKTRPYHEHNAERERPRIIKELQQGKIIALVSDAGTPLISDPGYKLVRACHEEKIPVTSCPGANAPLTALQLSGLPSDSFAFAGFPPVKSGSRKALFRSWQTVNATLLFFERASRLTDTLTDMIEVFGDRDGAIVREMTKKFEEIRKGSLSDLVDSIEHDPPKGEIVLVVEGLPESEKTGAGDMKDMLKEALLEMSLRDAAAYVAEATGLSKREVYETALNLSAESAGQEDK